MALARTERNGEQRDDELGQDGVGIGYGQRFPE
jgi:hypothetical protein